MDLGDPHRVDDEPYDPVPFGYSKKQVPVASAVRRLLNPLDWNGADSAG